MLAQLQSAPAKVKRLAVFGSLLGIIVLLSFCASAFAGHVGWGRALASGIVQFLLLWFVSFSVQASQRWAWWALLFLVLLRVWGGLGHTMRMVRITMEGGLAQHGREIVFDLTGMAALVVCGVPLWLLFTREVRDHVHKTVA